MGPRPGTHAREQREKHRTAKFSPTKMSDAAAASATAPVVAAPAPVRGLNTSRRPWKKPQTQRASAMTRTKSSTQKGSITRFLVNKAARKAIEVAKAAEKARAEEIAAKKQELKRKREEKAKRKADNELKSSSYQVVSVDPCVLLTLWDCAVVTLCALLCNCSSRIQRRSSQCQRSSCGRSSGRA